MLISNFLDDAAYETDEEDEENNGIESDNQSNDSGYLSHVPYSNNDEEHINMTGEIEMTLMYSFEDVCIDLVNGQECDNVLCDSNHAFPAPNRVRQRLAQHTEAQIDKAFELVLKSKILKKRYYDVFEPFLTGQFD